MKIYNKLLDCLPVSFKKPFHDIFDYYNAKNNKEIEYLKNKKGSRFILMGIPEHGNMGDQAIVYAEQKFLNHYFDSEAIEISSNAYRRNGKKVRKYVNREDVIVITGGGSLGTLWQNESDHILQLIEDFSDNLIVVFPQTLYFDGDAQDKVNEMKTVFDNAPNLFLCVREKNSYSVALENKLIRQERLLIIPDIVLFLELEEQREKSDQVLCVFRNDLEKIANNDIGDVKEKNNCEIKEIDTVIRHLRVTKDNREKELKKLIAEFQSARLVITDRLHGMILATISGTECFALDNSSKKVSGVYEFLRELDYVTFFENIEDMKNKIEMVSTRRNIYSNDMLLPYYDKLAEIIRTNRFVKEN